MKTPTDRLWSSDLRKQRYPSEAHRPNPPKSGLVRWWWKVTPYEGHQRSWCLHVFGAWIYHFFRTNIQSHGETTKLWHGWKTSQLNLFFATSIQDVRLMLQKSHSQPPFGCNSYLSLNWWVNTGFLHHQQVSLTKTLDEICDQKTKAGQWNHDQVQ